MKTRMKGYLLDFDEEHGLTKDQYTALVILNKIISGELEPSKSKFKAEIKFFKNFIDTISPDGNFYSLLNQSADLQSSMPEAVSLLRVISQPLEKTSIDALHMKLAVGEKKYKTGKKLGPEDFLTPEEYGHLQVVKDRNEAFDWLKENKLHTDKTTALHITSTQIIKLDKQVPLENFSILDRYKKSFREEYGLTLEQHAALKILTKRSKVDFKFSIKQSEFLKNFLESAIGNMELNMHLRQLPGDNKIVSSKINGILQELTFRTRRVELMDEVISKSENCLNKFQAQTSLSELEKLTLKEYSILYDAAKIESSLSTFKEWELLSPSLSTLHAAAVNANINHSAISTSFINDFKFQPGSLIFDNIQKKVALEDQNLNLISKLVSNYVTAHGHVATGVNKDSVNLKSHINPEYKLESFNLRDSLYSDIYVLQFDKLIPEKNHKILKTVLGDDWLNNISNMYHRLEQQIHDKQLTNRVTVRTTNEMYLAGTKKFQLFGHSKTFSMFANKKKHETIHDFFFQSTLFNQAAPKQQPMLCSELSGKMMIAILMEIRKELNTRITDYDRGNETKLLSQIKGDLVTIPIPQTERLRYLQPDRLLTLLKEPGYIKAIERPAINQVFNLRAP